MFYLIRKISSILLFLIKNIWTKKYIKINFQQIWKLLPLDKKYWYQLHMMWKKKKTHIIFTELILGSWKIVKSYVDGLSICLLQQDSETSLEVKMSLIKEWNDMVEIIWELFVKINS